MSDFCHLKLKNYIFMKNEQQVIGLLDRRGCKSINDWEVIQLFCQKHKVILRFFQPGIEPELGISLPQFIEWYDNGFGDGDIVGYKDGYAVITMAGLKECNISGYYWGNVWVIDEGTYPYEKFQKLDTERQAQIDTKLSMIGTEYSYGKCDMMPKYTPKPNDRVKFYNIYHSGLGIVRSIDVENNEVELYCYYMYNEKTLGYNMHEGDVITYHEYHFEPMSIPMMRRLNSELEKVGKVWYDKLHRIEPLQVKAPKGGKYWYINDKMKLVEDIEKGTPTSNFRYIAGNYFLDYKEGLDYLGRFCDILKDRLAMAPPRKDDSNYIL